MDYVSKKGALNHKHGLVICGIQMGGDESHAKNDIPDSKKYFSAITHMYQRTIIKRFELWEHPLETEESKMSGFEKSIIGIEWIDGHCPKTSGTIEELSKHSERILKLLKDLEPRLLFLHGKYMLEVLNSVDMKSSVEKILGKALNKPSCIERVCDSKGSVGEVSFQKFENCQVIQFPHPRRAITDDFVKSFKVEIKPLIDEYKEYRKFKGV
ncbi:hypothetical protein [Helicobacter cetorum]|uniref:hypothetical protein n=1 Tax=Helicobacter cetorum TaxID=138563 RepID=UPI000CF14FAF|nr:hypothetical protein [Helicobacter cetorum]